MKPVVIEYSPKVQKLLDSIVLPGVKGRVIVVDGNNMMARNGHVYANLTAPDGRPSGALYGCVKECRKWAAAYGPVKSIIFVKDAGRPQFRVEAVQRHADEGDGYKAHRAEKRDKKAERIYQNNKAQLDYCDEVFTPLGIHVVHARGFEADDLVGSIVQSCTKPKFIVVSGDKDYHQLVRERVTVINPSTGAEVDPPPKNYVLMRAHAGDTSDNIPGIKGVGETTFYKIAQMAGLSEVTMPRKFVDGLKEWADKQKKVPAAVTKIIEGRDALCDYYKAMDMRRTAGCFAEATVKHGKFDPKEARAMCRKYAFREFMAEWDRFVAWLGKIHERAASGS